jgi:hypothetical protein
MNGVVAERPGLELAFGPGKLPKRNRALGEAVLRLPDRPVRADEWALQEIHVWYYVPFLDAYGGWLVYQGKDGKKYRQWLSGADALKHNFPTTEPI